jgi:hypothetical protein
MSTNDPYYDRFIPGQRDPFADWQIDIQQNFNILNTIFAKNHVGFYSQDQTSSTDQGKHTYVQLKAGETPQTILSENNVYTKLDAFGAAQLFMAMQNNTANFQYSAFQNFSFPIENPTTFSTCLPGNFSFIFALLPTSGNQTFVPVPNHISDLAYISASSFKDTNITGNNFVVQVVANQQPPFNQSIAITWNGGQFFPPPSSFFLMYIGKNIEVTS